jgi:hypothetical protein
VVALEVSCICSVMDLPSRSLRCSRQGRRTSQLSLRRSSVVLRCSVGMVEHDDGHDEWVAIEPITHNGYGTGCARTELVRLFHHGVGANGQVQDGQLATLEHATVIGM